MTHPQPCGMCRIFHLPRGVDELSLASKSPQQRQRRWTLYAQGNVRRVLLVALQPHGVAPRPARAEHGRVVRAEDEGVPLRVGEVLGERFGLGDVVPALKSTRVSTTT